jgi:hypothetical protein
MPSAPTGVGETLTGEVGEMLAMAEATVDEDMPGS